MVTIETMGKSTISMDHFPVRKHEHTMSGTEARILRIDFFLARFGRSFFVTTWSRKGLAKFVNGNSLANPKARKVPKKTSGRHSIQQWNLYNLTKLTTIWWLQKNWRKTAVWWLSSLYSQVPSLRTKGRGGLRPGPLPALKPSWENQPWVTDDFRKVKLHDAPWLGQGIFHPGHSPKN